VTLSGAETVHNWLTSGYTLAGSGSGAVMKMSGLFSSLQFHSKKHEQ